MARLCTGHFEGMKISPHGQRSHSTCPHYPEIQLSPGHIFNCPSTLHKLYNTDYKLLYLTKAFDIINIFLNAFDDI